MPSKTLQDFDPIYGYRKNVFVINDVDLIVPPTNINVQTEDLTWQWKALRQKASTKIPSGSGQVAVQVSIPFTSSMMLDMHRLIVEFRHSPFCYIENRFLRETIVPHWPYTQSMAFTMTNMSLAPMQGTSDTWVMTLDLTWFNYFPYVHNWFYRQDWHTAPVQQDTALSEGKPVELTIGWDWVDGVKLRRHNVLPTLSTSGRKSVLSYNAVQQEYDLKSVNTIEDMQTAFRGEVFDSMPLPSRMAKSFYVRRPSKSKIYTRYINFLQRDSLLENFGFDVEAKIAGNANLKAALFNALKVNDDRFTYGLHTGPDNIDDVLRNDWVALRNDILFTMNSYHREMNFHFFAYQEIRLPQEYNEKIAAAHQKSVNDLKPKTGNTSEATGDWLLAYGPGDATVEKRYRVRRGWSMSHGKDGEPRTTPIGKPGSDTPMPPSDLRVTSRLKWRDAETRNRLYKTNRYTQGYMHWGTDFGGDAGSPIFSVEAGTISSVKLTSSAQGHSWKFYNEGFSSYIADAKDFKASIAAFDPNIIVGDNKVSAKDSKSFPVGTFVKSLAHPTGWYYVEGSPTGNKVTISHGNNFSSYFHMASVEPGITVGAKVQAGQKIGTIGNTGFLSSGYKSATASKASEQYNAQDKDTRRFVTRTNENVYTDETGKESSVWGFSKHLHFEYWESQDHGYARDVAWDGDPEIPEMWRRSSRHIPVDPVTTFEMAEQSNYKLVARPGATQPTKTSVKESLAEGNSTSVDADGNPVGEDPVLANVGDILDSLWADGWYYYDRDSSVKNVWWKHHVLQVSHGNLESMAEGFLDDPLITTAVAGGLQHIVANIPILGHEFPTQQHLGSVEPFYSFEFCAKDFEGSGTQYLAGVSKKAEMLLSMRSLLHANARNFRPITDSWCVAVDSFVTRILGSYKESDYREAVAEDVITDVDVKRRMLNTRGNSMTVPGSPGLTCHTLDFMETNPYTEQKITATAVSTVDKQEAHEKILNAVYNLEFSEDLNTVLNKVLVAQLAGANVSLPGDEDYGKINIDYVKHPGSVSGTNVAAYRDSSDNDWLIFGDDFSSFSNMPGDIGKLAGSKSEELTSIDPRFANINAVPFETVFGGLDFEGGINTTVTTVVKDTAGVNYSTLDDETEVTKKYISPRLYDISAILNESRNNQMLGEIPLEKILMYSQIIHTLVDTANRMLAETQDQLTYGSIQPGGSTIDTARKELYNLPVTPGLYKGFSFFLAHMATSYASSGPTHPDFFPGAVEAFKHISDNPNWIKFSTAFDQDELIKKLQDITLKEKLAYAVENTSDTVGSFARAQWDLGAYFVGALGDVFTASSMDDRGVYADLWEARNEEALEDLSVRYISFLPIEDLLEERFKSFVTSSIIGKIAGSIKTEDGNAPVFASTAQQLTETTRSCGNFQVKDFGDLIKYVVEPRGLTRGNIEGRATARAGEEEDENSTGLESDGQTVEDAKVSFNGPDGTWMSVFVNEATGFKPLNSPFVWHVDAALETKKLEYFKKLLARYAEEMRIDFDILRAFSLTEYSNISQGAAISGSPALPDMDLPHHPYYGTLSACPPDFYMWNMYEDGNAHDRSVIEAIEDSMEQIITNCYNSMHRVTSKTKENYKPSTDPYVLEPEVSDRLSLPMHYDAEASDITPYGATAFPFYPNPNSTEAIAKHLGDVNEATKKALERADAARSGSPTSSRDGIISAEQAKALSSTEGYDVRLSNFEGAYGEGGGVQYPRRLTNEGYNQLFAQVKTMTNMFGSRSGYLNSSPIPGDVKARLSGTILEREDSPTHKFDKDALNKLAKESAADIFSQKRQMKRAYPTFKLFFVEEDEFESRLLNFDDFYSYNGVTSFTIEQSRKSPADHAIITLLNVAGTLDGTKRDAVVDLDYFGDPDKVKVPREASTTAGNPVTQDTALDQPFGALVLRPGLNVQLRVGYSNDPDLLEVMINGRVVDVTWNSGGDRAEILVQSFGTELQQIIKGTTSNNDSRAFPTTHHLLGALMLEPELVHFGRWEFGKLYQIGEGQDARLDFYDYTKEGSFGSFRAPAAVVGWLLDNPIITGTLAIGGGALISRIPGVGRLFRRFGATSANALSKGAAKTTRASWVGRWLDTLGVGGPGAAAYRSGLVRAIRARTGGQATVAATITRREIGVVLRNRAAQLEMRNRALREAGKVVGASDDFVRKGAEIHAKAVRSARGLSADDAAVLLAKADREIANLIQKGQWGYNPLAQIAGQSTGLLAQVGSIGRASVGRIFSGITTKQPVFLAGAATAALALAPMDWVLTSAYDATLKRFKAYFRKKQVSLMLSPQDDNLFPPHPKDYMQIETKGFFEGLRDDFRDYVIKQGISAFTSSDELGYQGLRWFNGEHPLDKRGAPEEYEFKLYATTIWDTFHEMSLRHPGWIYAARPYGKEFRYTMFFGVPSQRYWSQGADNGFVKRANDLSRMLNLSEAGARITMEQYRRLYGDSYDDGESNYALEEYDALIEKSIFDSHVTAATSFDVVSEGTLDPDDPATGYLVSNDPGAGLETTLSEVDDAAIQKEIDSARQLAYTSRALKEYMTALQLRFKPFRRYHSITSEQDIVWNGLISSENAVYNGVDVTYFDPDAERGDAPVSSALFKAHSFIPDHNLRVMPMQPSYNTRGYSVAMRYGQGALLHTMREMYRGEIIVLGNARIRPWDVGILSDSYNDMVGPFEVEQVVHQFSHETGFITEIKPSAIVIANETSSWPIIEAMKVASLAIRDVDDQFQGLGPSDPGIKFKAIEWALGFGGVDPEKYPGAAKEYREYLESRAKDLQPFDFTLNPETGESDLEELREVERRVEKAGRRAAATAGIAVGGVLAFTTAGLALKGLAVTKSGAAFAAKAGVTDIPRVVSGVAKGAAVIGAAVGGTSATFALEKTTPSISWLLGSPILFMQCLRNDSIMLVPLMKSGKPIVSGVSLRDPGSLWNSFKGDLGRWVEHHIDGTKDLTNLWKVYGMHAWRRNNTLENLTGGSSSIPASGQLDAELTGETK